MRIIVVVTTTAVLSVPRESQLGTLVERHGVLSSSSLVIGVVGSSKISIRVATIEGIVGTIANIDATTRVVLQKVR
jgi:hypothetical protein